VSERLPWSICRRSACHVDTTLGRTNCADGPWHVGEVVFDAREIEEVENLA
jgi:hypothetical protein